MTDASPPGPSAAPAPGTVPRKPRKIFLLVGILLAVALGIFLFTGLGTSPSSSGAPHEGGPVPSFSASNIGPVGAAQVSVPAGGGGNGTPAVLLFFGAWCTSCRQELPPLTAAVRRQDSAGGALARIRVIGVDSFDGAATAKSFMAHVGVRFPVASDPQAAITSGLFYFKGDPYTVFVKGDGTISKIVIGAQLSASDFSADERALIPSGT
jgi:cytochrome c biogenesis protein CcmG/thiol:disulfide interchange protein DsbE